MTESIIAIQRKSLNRIFSLFMRRTNLTFGQNGDELKPLTTNEIKPLSEDERRTLSQLESSWLACLKSRPDLVWSQIEVLCGPERIGNYYLLRRGPSLFLDTRRWHPLSTEGRLAHQWRQARSSWRTPGAGPPSESRYREPKPKTNKQNMQCHHWHKILRRLYFFIKATV